METRTIILLLLLFITGTSQAQFAINNELVNSSTSFYVIGYAEFTNKTTRDSVWNIIVNYPKIQNNAMRGGYANFPEKNYYDLRIEFIVNNNSRISNFVSNLETLRTSANVRLIIIKLFYCDTLITDWTDVGNKYSYIRMSTYTK